MLAYRQDQHQPSPTSSGFPSSSSSRSVNSNTASQSSPQPSPISTTGSHGALVDSTEDKHALAAGSEGARGQEIQRGAEGGEETLPHTANGASASALSAATDGSNTPFAPSPSTPVAPPPPRTALLLDDNSDGRGGINPLFALGERARAGELDPSRIVVQKDGVVVREGKAFDWAWARGRGGKAPALGAEAVAIGKEQAKRRHFFRTHHQHGTNRKGQTLQLDDENPSPSSSSLNGVGGSASDPDGDGRANAVQCFRDHPYEQDRVEQVRMKMRSKKEEVQDMLQGGGWVTPDDEHQAMETLDPQVKAALDRREIEVGKHETDVGGHETDGAGASSFYSVSQGGEDGDVSSAMAAASTATVDSVQTAAPSLPSIPPRSDSPLSYASLSEAPISPPLPPQQPSPSPSFTVNGANRSPQGTSNTGFVVTSRRSPHPSPPLAVPTASPSPSSALPPRTCSLAATPLVSPTPIRRVSGGVLPVRSSPSYTDDTRQLLPPQSHLTAAPFLPASLPRTESPLPIPHTQTPPPPPAGPSTTATGHTLAVPSSPLHQTRRLSSASSSASNRSRGATVSVPSASLPSYQIPPQRSNSGSYPANPPLHSPLFPGQGASYHFQPPFSPSLPSHSHPNAHLLQDDVDASIAAQAEAIRRQRQEKRLEAEREAAKAEKEKRREVEKGREREKSKERVPADRAPGAGPAGGAGAGQPTGLGVTGLGAGLKRRSTRMGSGSSSIDQAVRSTSAARAATAGADDATATSPHGAETGGAVHFGAAGISDDAANLPTPSGGISAQPSTARRTKAAGLEDDEGPGTGGAGAGVLVGNLIGQDHANYVLMYNMLTGIRIGVSRCQAKLKRPLTDADYTARHKFSFDIVGNELTPSVRYDFKFKDYAPWVFRELREYFYLDPSDYLVSLTAKYILSEIGSPGKSGSFFYFSRDYRFIIKTIRHSEHKFLRSILKDYHAHIKSNPHTLLSRFYGLHRVKLPRGRKIHFVIFNNLFPPHRDIHETYDLKGSAIGRLYPEEKAANNPHAVLKDLNWVGRHRQLALGPEKKALFEEQLRRDTEFLQRLGIMDYSLLTGIHNGLKGNEGLREDKLSVFQPDTVKVSRKPTQVKRDADASALRKAVERSDPQALGDHELPSQDASERRLFLFYQDEGGMRATGDNNEDLGVIYYLGIIDILTPFTFVKRIEHLFKGMQHDKHMISAVPPKEYGDRFLAFIKSCIRGNDESLRPKMFETKHKRSKCGGADGGAETTPPTADHLPHERQRPPAFTANNEKAQVDRQRLQQVEEEGEAEEARPLVRVLEMSEKGKEKVQ
ncbi:hypothetical protein JCM11251_001500 [Rhodosporidiobolus azoricus]